MFVFVSIYGILGAIGSAVNIPTGVSGGSYSGGSTGGNAGGSSGIGTGGGSGTGNGGGTNEPPFNPSFPTPGECVSNPDLCGG